MSFNSQLIESTEHGVKRTIDEAELNKELSTEEPAFKKAKVIADIAQTGLIELPNEMWKKIFSYLHANDLGICSRVCKNFVFLVDRSPMWVCLAKKINIYQPLYSHRVDFMFAKGNEQPDALLAWSDFYDEGEYVSRSIEKVESYLQRVMEICYERPTQINKQFIIEVLLRRC